MWQELVGMVRPQLLSSTELIEDHASQAPPVEAVVLLAVDGFWHACQTPPVDAVALLAVVAVVLPIVAVLAQLCAYICG